MSETSGRSLTDPFVRAFDPFPTTTILEAFEAGMYLLHESLAKLRSLSSVPPPNTKVLDIGGQALEAAATKHWGPLPADKARTLAQKKGAEGYLSDQEAVLTGLVTAIDTTEQNCRTALTNICKRLDTYYWEDIVKEIDAADEMIHCYLDEVGDSNLPFARDIAHKGSGTPLGDVLHLVSGAKSYFAAVSDLLMAAKSWSVAIDALGQLKAFAIDSNGTFNGLL